MTHAATIQVPLTHRIVVCGSPKSGKSTYALQLLHTQVGGTFLYHLDSLIASHAWSDQSEVALKYLTEASPCIVEGCAAVRALRKYLDRHVGRPCDTVVRMATPRVELSRGQETLRKGEVTIWREIESELQRRGVAIELRPGTQVT